MCLRKKIESRKLVKKIKLTLNLEGNLSTAERII